MQLSAELRWFWNTPQEQLKDWFCGADAHGFVCGGATSRVDSYLRAPQVELGLKHRGGKNGVEIKGLVSIAERSTTNPFEGEVELWSKWTSETLRLDMERTVTTEKQRWLRKFDTTRSIPVEIRLDGEERSADNVSPPIQGCSVEFTQVRFLDWKTDEQIEDTSVWWTFSFESFGELHTVHRSMIMVAETIASREPPEFDASLRLSYPAWLSRYAPQPVLMKL